MTLKEIYEYIEPLLHDDDMATQAASLILHFPNGGVEVVKKDEGIAVCTPTPLGLEGERLSP